MRSPARAALWLCFFASGATGLLYEIVWMRELILVFGSTTYAVSSVLAAYMLGLAIGAFALGRAADRGVNLVRLYGFLEIGVGLYALVAPWLLRTVAPLFVSLSGEDPTPGPLTTGARFLGALAILLPPTILMGGTLPVLASTLSRPGQEHAGPVSRLYALNTFGAVVGTFLTGFVLLPSVGMRATTLIAAAVNLALGAAAVLIARRWQAATAARLDTAGPLAAAALPDPAAGSTPTESRAANRWAALLAFGLSGFAAMLYEVGWTRVLSLTIGSSVYGFSLMLIAFLAGLAAGAALFSRIASRPRLDPVHGLALVLVGVGVASWGTSLLFYQLPYFFARLFAWSAGRNLVLHFAELGLCLVIMAPATLLMGGVFPFVLRIYAARSAEVARHVGEAYTANTIGTVLGAACGGFLLLPLCGVRITLLAAVGIDLVCAALVLGVAARRPARLAGILAGTVVAIVVLVGLAPAWDILMMNSGVYVQPEELGHEFSRDRFQEFAVGTDQILYYKEGVVSSVLVGRTGGTNSVYLKVNGKADASTGLDMKTQVLLGQIPMLFHPDPKKVLVIGLASGISVASAATHPAESIRVLEVEPAMVGACRVFDTYNRHVLDDPRVRVVFNDARNDVLLRPDAYDVVISEPSNPWMTVASNLFTREFFAAARRRVRPGGIFCQWFQVYSLTPEDLRSLLATFRTAFPNMLVFGVGDASDLIVLGSDRPIPLDWTALSGRMTELPIAVDLARVGIRRPEDLLAQVYMDSPEVGAYVQGARLNTDDNALIEFSAPLSLHSETIWANQRLILGQRTPVASRIVSLPSEPQERRTVFLDLAAGLLREERPRAALEALGHAESLGSDARSAELRQRILAKIPL